MESALNVAGVFVDQAWLDEQRAKKTAKNRTKREKQRRNKQVRARLREEQIAEGARVFYTDGSAP